MTTFDELIGEEPDGAERARLRNVHDLLLEAGPPPELTPEVASGPTLAMTLGRPRAHSSRRRAYALTAVAAALVALVVGLAVTGNSHHTTYPAFTLHGTTLAPNASGSLYFLKAQSPRPQLKLEVKGLPAVAKPYVVYLVRNGRPVAPCGSFTVSNPHRELTTVITSPYRLQGSDQWIVTASGPGTGIGPTVLKPA